jgi:hypothetical protein
VAPDRRNIGSAACHGDWEAAWTGKKLGMRIAAETVSPQIFRLRRATVTKMGLPQPASPVVVRLAPPQEMKVDTHKPVLCGLPL